MEVWYVLYTCCIVERDKAPNKPEGRSTVLLLAILLQAIRRGSDSCLTRITSLEELSKNILATCKTKR